MDKIRGNLLRRSCCDVVNSERSLFKHAVDPGLVFDLQIACH